MVQATAATPQAVVMADTATKPVEEPQAKTESLLEEDDEFEEFDTEGGIHTAAPLLAPFPRAAAHCAHLAPWLCQTERRQLCFLLTATSEDTPSTYVMYARCWSGRCSCITRPRAPMPAAIKRSVTMHPASHGTAADVASGFGARSSTFERVARRQCLGPWLCALWERS